MGVPESGCGLALGTRGSDRAAAPSQHGQSHPRLRSAPPSESPPWCCHDQLSSGT